MASIQEEQCVQPCLTFCDLMDCSPPGSLSIKFSWQECWSWLPFPPQWNLPDPVMELASYAWEADSLLLSLRGSPERRSRRSAKSEGWRRGEWRGHIFWLARVNEEEGGGRRWENSQRGSNKKRPAVTWGVHVRKALTELFLRASLPDCSGNHELQALSQTVLLTTGKFNSMRHSFHCSHTWIIICPVNYLLIWPFVFTMGIKDQWLHCCRLSTHWSLCVPLPMYWFEHIGPW